MYSASEGVCIETSGCACAEKRRAFRGAGSDSDVLWHDEKLARGCHKTAVLPAYIRHMTTRIAASYVVGALGYGLGMMFSVFGYVPTGLAFLSTTAVVAVALFCSQAGSRIP